MRVPLAIAVLTMLVLAGCLQGSTSGTDDPAGNEPQASTESEATTNPLPADSTSDADGDGIMGAADNCPSVANSGQDDLDGDGQGDACDEDRDGDGLSNDDEATHATDPDNDDTDDDGDSDGEEVAAGSDPNDSSSTVDDIDGDGIVNTQDNCPDTANEDQADADNDGTGDACEDGRDVEELVPGTPKLASSFTGFLRTGSAFSSIAAGLDRVLGSTHGEVGLFLKDGVLVDRTSHNHFFRSVLPSGESLTDPRVSYDYQSNRFFVVAASGAGGTGCVPENCPNTWTVAVSKTDSPRTLTSADWYFWGFDGTLTDGEQSGLWGDFSIVAADERIIVINGQMVRHHPEPRDSVYDRLWVFDKSDFLTGQPISNPEKEFYNIEDPKTGKILRQRFLPAMNLEGSEGIFFVHFGYEECDMIVGQVSSTTSGASTSELVVWNVPVPGKTCGENEGPVGEQLGGGPPINIHPHITSAPVYHDGSLWIAQAVPAHYADGFVSGVRILKLNVSAWPETPTIEEDQTLSEKDVSYAYPAISVSRAGDVAVVFNRMSPSTYISLYYTGRLSTDPAGSFRDVVPLMPGKAYHDYPGSSEDFLLFGAHSGAALDPVDDSVWFIGQYPERPCVSGARIAQVVFVDGGDPAIPPPPTPNGGDEPCINTHESPY